MFKTMPTTKSKHPINDRIIEKMAEAGLDEMALSAASGLPKATIYRITKREVKPNRSTVEVISRALKANFSYLFTGVHREPEAVTNDTATTPYRDYAIKQLEIRVEEKAKEASTWQQKYDQVWKQLAFFQERIPWDKLLGKFDPVKGTAQKLKAA